MDSLDVGPKSRTVVDRMEHLHVSARDVDRTIAFYKAAFGFEVRHDAAGPYGRTAHVGTDRFYIAISEGGDPDLGTGNVSHLGFVTPDLAAFKARLEREGIPIAETASRKEGDALYVIDPDGIEIEVVGYRSDYKYR
jgi:catechol 2,3-dioxygenase-like lactoylglutathione lyase family enzyme